MAFAPGRVCCVKSVGRGVPLLYNPSCARPICTPPHHAQGYIGWIETSAKEDVNVNKAMRYGPLIVATRQNDTDPRAPTVQTACCTAGPFQSCPCHARPSLRQESAAAKARKGPQRPAKARKEPPSLQI